MKSCSRERNVGDVERLGSMAVGAWLLLKGLVSRRALPTALGGLLIYRGLSGSCKCYELLDIDTRSEGEKTSD
jgi:Protein of unknown function (DUF2892).